MRRRCTQPQDQAYPRYGGRGIKVCPEWMTYAPFLKWALANGYEPHLTLERINNDGDYEPGNCRWATRKEQALNTSCSLPPLTIFGETKAVDEWASDTRNVVSRLAFRRRLQLGWEPQRALTAPKDTRRLGARHRSASPAA